MARLQLVAAALLVAAACCAAQAPAATMAVATPAAATPAATAAVPAATTPAATAAAAPAPKAAKAAPLKYAISSRVAEGSSLKALLGNNHLLFARIANASGLIPTLNSTKTRATIFAPTDAAVTKLATEFGVTPEELLKNQLLVDRLAGYHILPNVTITSNQLKSGQTAAMARGGNLTVKIATAANKKATVTLTGAQNSAVVTKPDILAGNVAIHSIDAVLLPADVFPTLKAALAFSPNAEAIKKLLSKDAALAKAVADPTTAVTFFMPSNKAVEAASGGAAVKAVLKNATAVKEVLQYHLVPGARILPNGVKATEELPTMLKGQSLAVQKVKMTNAKTGAVTGVVEVSSDAKGAVPAKVVKLNVIAGASLIQVVDGLLLPKTA